MTNTWTQPSWRTYDSSFPKPSQSRQVPKFLCEDGVFRYPNGREVCKLEIKNGRDEYFRRKRAMWERQSKKCGLSIAPQCKAAGGKLNWADAQFGHQAPRGHGGGSRDDRIEIDGKPHNYALCVWCNSLQGSRRISMEDVP